MRFTKEMLERIGCRPRQVRKAAQLEGLEAR